MSAALTTNTDQRLLRTTKFPAEFNTKVDMQKVNISIIKNWATDRLAKLLNDDDDVVPELVSNMLEASRYPKIKDLQIALGGFLNKDAPPFCLELWKLCISAEQSPLGVPKELLEAKKQELERERIEEAKVREQQIERSREAEKLRSGRDRGEPFRRDHRPDYRSHDRRSRSRTPIRRRRSPSPRYRRRGSDTNSHSASNRRRRSSSLSSRSSSYDDRRRSSHRGDERDRFHSHNHRRRSRSPGRRYRSPPRHRSDRHERTRTERPQTSSSMGDVSEAGTRTRSPRRDPKSGPQRGSDDYRHDRRRLSRDFDDEPTFAGAPAAAATSSAK